MKVKDIFALRKQGKIEEAYEAIRPIYREHKGKFSYHRDARNKLSSRGPCMAHDPHGPR